MRGQPTISIRQHRIRSEYDVVAMRQEVRQVARELGLGLSQQARIATAIGAISRALLAANCEMSIRVWADDALPQLVLELACHQDGLPTLPDTAHFEQLLQFGAARALVDEATLSMNGSEARLNLRMWLRR